MNFVKAESQTPNPKKWYLVKCPGGTPSGLAIARWDIEIKDPEEDGDPEWVAQGTDQHIHKHVTDYYATPLADVIL